MILDLTGKKAIIGGASQGIGKAIAIKFASAGADLILLARSENDLNYLIKNLPSNGSQSFYPISVDFADIESLRSKLGSLLPNFGKVDIVVNNTGGPSPAPAHKASPEDYLLALHRHLIAFQTILDLVLDGMRSNGFGRIINITSVGAKQPVDNLGVSNTVRGAVSAWAKTLSRELASYGITVNNLLPGYIDTDRLRFLFGNIAEKRNISFETVRAEKISEIPAGRIGLPEEIANAALFLASSASSYITGINLPVDGGLLRTL